jgi:hypothetical protein
MILKLKRLGYALFLIKVSSLGGLKFELQVYFAMANQKYLTFPYVTIHYLETDRANSAAQKPATCCADELFSRSRKIRNM